MEMISLREWAELSGVNIQTAQRYVREDRIQPGPVKDGRAFKVARNAVLVDYIKPHRLTK